MKKHERTLLEHAKAQFAQNPTVRSVSLGYRYRGGKKTGEKCIVVGVVKKMAANKIDKSLIIPQKYHGVQTDVQDRDLKAIGIDIQTNPQSLTGKKRPCPGGFSIGHYKITAGTLGAWVRYGTSDDYFVLSNNHVLAASNDAMVNDEIYQPGPHDGGTSSDLFGRLEEWAKINFGDDEKKKLGKTAWKAWQWPANALARAVGCPYRMRVSTRAVEQPNPNLVDAAIARPLLQSYVDPTIWEDMEIAGIRDLVLGDRVQKTGRTTGHTVGTVEGIGAMVRVSYGGNKIATYDNQVEIRADSGEFSAGGDSGSVILTMEDEPYLGGLLFAGGSGVTISNRISDVVALMGVRL